MLTTTTPDITLQPLGQHIANKQSCDAHYNREQWLPSSDNNLSLNIISCIAVIVLCTKLLV